MTRKSVAMLLGAALALAAAAPARAQSVRLQIDSRELYTGVPFILGLVAEGFAEEPQPEQPILEIADCKVTALGVHPNVSTSIAIINGRRSASHQVTFVFRYRVEATRAGRFEIPALSVFQSGKAASTRPSAFMVKEIAKSRDMRLRLTLPERQVWLGEVFDVTIDWYLARDPSDQSFHIPIFADEDWILVSAPPAMASASWLFRSPIVSSSSPTVSTTRTSTVSATPAFASTPASLPSKPASSTCPPPAWSPTSRSAAPAIVSAFPAPA